MGSVGNWKPTKVSERKVLVEEGVGTMTVETFTRLSVGTSAPQGLACSQDGALGLPKIRHQ